MWPQIAVAVVAILLSAYLAPKPQNPKPGGLGDLKVPTASEGKSIPVLFGTRDISDPNVVWYGDLKTVAVKAKGGKK